MNSRVICFRDKNEAIKIKEHDDEILTDWNGFIQRRGVPDKVFNFELSGSGLQPDKIIVNKGELIILKIKSEGMSDNVTLFVKGYPEVDAVTVPSDGTDATMRILALRPGAGFPIMDKTDNKPVGMIRVEGAHTTDEEAM